MSLCQCPEGPRCELYNRACAKRADWTIMVPLTWKPPLRLGPKFACGPCLEYFRKAWTAPIKGIDRPEGADEEWQPSLVEMMRHARISMAFDARNERPEPAWSSLHHYDDEKRYTPAQLQQVMILRRHMLEHRPR